MAMTQALLIQFRVIAALVLREAKTRRGRSKLSYLWLLLEPVATMVLLTVLFTNFRGKPPFGDSFGVFFATGVLILQLFRNVSSRVGSAFNQNKPLFKYPLIHQVDAALARTVLEFTTWIIVITAVLSFLILTFDTSRPHNLPGMALPAILIAVLGLGIGLMNASIARKYPTWLIFYGIFRTPLVFVSAIFYTMESLPPEGRYWLSFNPIVHGVEGLRMNYYPNYRCSILDMVYLFYWSLISLFWGLALERLTRKIDTS